MFLIYDIVVGITSFVLLLMDIKVNLANDHSLNNRQSFYSLLYGAVGFISLIVTVVGVDEIHNNARQVFLLCYLLLIASSLAHSVFNNFIYYHLNDSAKERFDQNHLVNCGPSLFVGIFLSMGLPLLYDAECSTTISICTEEECYGYGLDGVPECSCLDWEYREQTPNPYMCLL